MTACPWGTWQLWLQQQMQMHMHMQQGMEEGMAGPPVQAGEVAAAPAQALPSTLAAWGASLACQVAALPQLRQQEGGRVEARGAREEGEECLECPSPSLQTTCLLLRAVALAVAASLTPPSSLVLLLPLPAHSMAATSPCWALPA